MKNRCFCLLVALVLCGGVAAAASLTYSGDSASTVFAQDGQRAVLTGHARVVTEDSVITADRIELFGKDFPYAICTGNVRIVNTTRGMELTSDQLFYNRQDKVARITGDAVMTDVKNELVVKGGFIEDRDKEKLTTIQIGVRILKKDLVCRAEFARYDRSNNTLELSGMPFVSKKGDEYRAARIMVNLDTEEITLEGDVSGQINSGGSAQTPSSPQSQPSVQPGQQATPAAPQSPQNPSPSSATPSVAVPAAPSKPEGGDVGH